MKLSDSVEQMASRFGENLNKFTTNELGRNRGLRNYIVDIHSKTASGLITTLLIGTIITYIVSQLNLSFGIIFVGYIINFVLSIVSLIRILSYESVTFEKDDEYYEVPNKNKEFWYTIFSICNGVTISPIISYANEINPLIIPTAVVSTIGTFGVLTLYALKQTSKSLITYEAPLVSCVSGLIFVSFFKILLLISGFEDLYLKIDFLSTVVSQLVFGALIIIDTNKAVTSYYYKKLDSIGVATDLLLDATNLLINFVKILSKIAKLTKK